MSMIAGSWRRAAGSSWQYEAGRRHSGTTLAIDEASDHARSAMTIRNYRDLIAWQKAMDLAESLYKTTQDMPREELYGLTSQMRRAAVSIPAGT